MSRQTRQAGSLWHAKEGEKGPFTKDVRRAGVKNMETIYWTCGGVANMVKIKI